MSSICRVPECDRTVRCKSLCATHYNNSLAGRPLKNIGPDSLKKRFRKFVATGGPEDCWEWLGAKANGYGRIGADGSTASAHRLAWSFTNGPIPDGALIDHRCNNRGCVNPAHLQIANKRTNGENRAKADRDSSSGVRGVSWDKRNKRWAAYAASNGKTYNGGRYASIEEAEAAAIALRNKIHTNNLRDRAAA